MLIKPKEVEIVGLDGSKKKFQVGRVPATEGREIFTQYATTAAPKLGDYGSNQALMLKLMSHCAVAGPNGQFIELANQSLIDNHVTDWEMLVKLEAEAIKYNTDFFSPERLSGILARFSQTLPKRISKILTQLSAQLSDQEKPASTN